MNDIAESSCKPVIDIGSVHGCKDCLEKEDSIDLAKTQGCNEGVDVQIIFLPSHFMDALSFGNESLYTSSEIQKCRCCGREIH